jgi:hypothetical protein
MEHNAEVLYPEDEVTAVSHTRKLYELDQREMAQKIFGELMAAMQRAARDIRPLDDEQAYALLNDSIAIFARFERFTRGLGKDAENGNA